MKIRAERSGFHCFDRCSSQHILLDEVVPKPDALSITQRTLSVALLNICDLNCHFCYRPKHQRYPSYGIC